MGLADDVSRAMKPLTTRLFNIIGRAVVKLVDNSTILQTLQLEVLDGQIHDEVPVFGQYGFTSVPFADGTAEAIVLFMNGDASQPVVVAIDDGAYRPTDWVEGESGHYTDEDNQDAAPDPSARVYHKIARGGIHEIYGTKVRLGGGLTEQGVVIDGKLKAYIDGQIRAVFNAHTHTVTVPGAGLTAPAGGGAVTGAASATTGAPSSTIAAAGDIVSSKTVAAT